MTPNQENFEKLEAFIDGDLDSAGRAEVEAQLNANPKLRRMVAELAATRGLVASLPRVAAPADLMETFQSRIERAVLLGDSESEPSDVSMRISRWPQLMSIAAILLMAVGLAAVVYKILPQHKGNPELAQKTPESGTGVSVTDPKSGDGQDSTLGSRVGVTDAESLHRSELKRDDNTDSRASKGKDAAAQFYAKNDSAGELGGVAAAKPGPSDAGEPLAQSLEMKNSGTANATNPDRDQAGVDAPLSKRSFKGLTRSLDADGNAKEGGTLMVRVNAEFPDKANQDVAEFLTSNKISYVSLPEAPNRFGYNVGFALGSGAADSNQTVAANPAGPNSAANSAMQQDGSQGYGARFRENLTRGKNGDNYNQDASIPSPVSGARLNNTLNNTTLPSEQRNAKIDNSAKLDDAANTYAGTNNDPRGGANYPGTDNNRGSGGGAQNAVQQGQSPAARGGAGGGGGEQYQGRGGNYDNAIRQAAADQLNKQSAVQNTAPSQTQPAAAQRALSQNVGAGFNTGNAALDNGNANGLNLKNVSVNGTYRAHLTDRQLKELNTRIASRGNQWIEEVRAPETNELHHSAEAEAVAADAPASDRTGGRKAMDEKLSADKAQTELAERQSEKFAAAAEPGAATQLQAAQSQRKAPAKAPDPAMAEGVQQKLETTSNAAPSPASRPAALASTPATLSPAAAPTPETRGESAIANPSTAPASPANEGSFTQHDRLSLGTARFAEKSDGERLSRRGLNEGMKKDWLADAPSPADEAREVLIVVNDQPINLPAVLPATQPAPAAPAATQPVRPAVQSEPAPTDSK